MPRNLLTVIGTTSCGEVPQDTKYVSESALLYTLPRKMLQNLLAGGCNVLSVNVHFFIVDSPRIRLKA